MTLTLTLRSFDYLWKIIEPLLNQQKVSQSSELIECARTAVGKIPNDNYEFDWRDVNTNPLESINSRSKSNSNPINLNP